MAFKVPNQYRVRSGIMGSDDSIGLCGAFEIPISHVIQNDIEEPILLREPLPLFVSKNPTHSILAVIADDGLPYSRAFQNWEHVSAYKHYDDKRYIPTWNEMCLIASLFWDEEDCVIQYHPPKSEYVNNNPYVLHLWRPIGIEMPIPPKELI